MSIVEVKAFKSSNGRLFATKAAATQYDLKTGFKDFYSDNSLFGGPDEAVPFEELLEWLVEVKEPLMEFLKNYKASR